VGESIDHLNAAFSQGGIQMSGRSRHRSGRNSKIARIAVGLASAVILFVVENIWIDARFRHRFHRFPSLVPAPESGAWFFVFVGGALALVLSVVCLILLLRSHRPALWVKMGTAGVVILAMLLSAQWFIVTNGQARFFQLLASMQPHRTVLTWQASRSPVAGYNVYRREAPGANFLKVNSSLVQGLTYTDGSVENGKIYYYVTRSVDSQGSESFNSNVCAVVVP
jgi:hypothetical protein